MPTNKKFKFGDTIRFEITTTNTGTVNISDIYVKTTSNEDSVKINDLQAKGQNETYNSDKFYVNHLVTMEDVIRGSITEIGTVTACNFTGRDNYELSEFCTDGSMVVPIEAFNPSLVLEIIDISNPQDGTSYVLGETITFSVKATNEGNVDFSKVVINGIEAVYNETGKYYECECTHIVEINDMINGYIKINAELTNYTFSPSTSWLNNFCNSVEVTLNNVMAFNPQVTTTVAETSSPQNGSTYALGETINYTVTIENTGNITLSNIEYGIDLIGDRNTVEILNSGETISVNETYIVTENDILTGNIVASPYFIGEISLPQDIDEQNIEVISTNSTVYTDAPNPQAQIIIQMPSDRIYIDDEINCSLTITNNGNLTLTNITYGSEKLGISWPVHSLQPGKSIINSELLLVNYTNVVDGTITVTSFGSANTPYNSMPTIDCNNGITCNTVEKDVYDKWQFTVNTEATNYGAKTTGIPFNLYGQTGVTLDVDWGDGNTSTLTSADYTVSDSRASVHEYAEPGIYTINISSTKWNKAYILGINDASAITNINNANISLYWWRRTLVSLDNSIPKVMGIKKYSSPTSVSSLSNTNNSFSYLFCNCNKLSSIYSNLFDNNTAVTYFEYCFYGCSSLSSIPSGLFDNNTAVTSFYTCFRDCSSLTTIPSGLFDNCPNVTTFYHCFYGCSSLSSIPTGLFDNCTAVTSFQSCFRSCSSLSSIPTGLFDNCTAVTNFSYCFEGCSSLTSIPQDLFRYNTAVTNFSYCFYCCTSLTTIPTDLFRYNTAVTTFQGCFDSCSSLTSIPQDLFRYNTAVTTFQECFFCCINILQIPQDLFKYNTLVSNFTRCFGGSNVGSQFMKLQSIPAGLFDNCINAEQFSQCFFDCKSLTSIPEHLFDNCPKAKSFQQCFLYDSFLETIPIDLFKYNTAVTTFESCFSGCTSLTSIPQDLFRYNTAVTDFGCCFQNCSIESIPEHLFDNCINVTNFRNCFYGCSIESIPQDLFLNNTNVTNFSSCFSGCSSLISIPTGLFDNCLDVTNFQSCFFNCSSLNDFTIRISSTKVSNANDFVTNKAGTTRTVQVPTGSTTQTTFNNVASSLGLTIQAI